MFLVTLAQRFLSETQKESLKTVLEHLGIEHRNWTRIVQHAEWKQFISRLGPENLDVLEISGGREWSRVGFKSYKSTRFPDFDICTQSLDQGFDLVIADQVFEHLERPVAAARNARLMLRAGGHFMIATPFLIQIHHDPIDCTRWTPHGLRLMLADAGFDPAKVKIGSWGNYACVVANLKAFGATKHYPWRPLRNDPRFPVVVWGIAQR